MKCERCGKEFVSHKRAGNRQKYCSGACRIKSQNERWYRSHREAEKTRSREAARRKRGPAVTRHASDEELLSGVRKLNLKEE